LLEHKAEVNGRDFLGKTALYTAAYQGNVSMAKLLRAHSADVSIPVWCDGYTPLHIAVHQKHLDMVEFLLQEKANVNQKDSLGRTPLHIAALVAHVDIAKCLLGYKAEVNITRTSSDIHLAPSAEQRFETPLHVAAQSDYPFVSVAKSVAFIKILKEYKVDFDAVDYLGQTPLHRAAANGHYLIVRQLLQYGAKSEIVDNNGCKPIDLTSDSNIKDLLLSVKQSNNKSFYKEAHQSPLLFATPIVQISSSREFEQVEQIILPPPNSYIEDDWEFRPACTIL
jgi:ankyrin repeat protein